MGKHAYIGLKVTPGATNELAGRLGGMKGVAWADLVTGRYDFLVAFECNGLAEQLAAGLGAIRNFPGVLESETFLGLGSALAAK